MNLNEIVPLVVYDDQCYLCIKFAKLVNFLARGKLSLVGHYSSFGEQIRSEILDSSALEMFWFVDRKMAYGGRAALFPLFKSILLSEGSKSEEGVIQKVCDVRCKTTKAVFVRSASLFSHSKKIKLNNSH